MKRLETPRLILRDWSIDDAGDMFAYASNPNIGGNAGWKPHENIGESMGIIQSFINGDQVWALELRESGKVIGSLGIHRDPHRPSNSRARMLGYVLSEDLWGRGLMTEAVKAAVKYVFSCTDVNILSIYHYDFNPASGRVAQKAGFSKEGQLKDSCVLYNGRLCSEVMYRLSREDWFSHKDM